MRRDPTFARHHRLALAATLCALAAAAPARAADETSAPAPPDPGARAGAPGPPEAQPAPSDTGARAPEPRAAQPAAPASPAAGPEVKHVLYVPEIVKAQLREEIKEEVVSQAKRENWAKPNAFPEWLRRFRFHGDLRLRAERDLFGRGNAANGEFPDFGAINAGSPFDMRGIDIADDRYLNVDQNRTRPRFRARFGFDVDLGRGFTSSVRLANGEGPSPVSTQTIGAAPGEFSKYPIWIDRAFVQFEPFKGEAGGLALIAGRMENPFFTTEILWGDIVSVDGIALQARIPIGAGLTPFLVGGAFPLYTTGLNYPPEDTQKFAMFNKWLYALQLGADWRPAKSFGLKLGAAFYYFDKLEGRLSNDQCRTDLKFFTCNTDDSRPLFAQRGNTYMALRTPSADALAQEAAGAPEYQYFGLASRFRELAVTGRVEIGVAPALTVRLDGEWVRNLGFSRKQIAPVALNNLGACAAPASGELGRCPFAGGNEGYLARFTLGSPTQAEPWDWNVGLSYRRLESDATVDAFDDPDFGLGGTNLKGFVFGGGLALAENVWAVLRWMSADAVAGPTLRVDVLQIDLSTRF
jgi:hypothetical protein